MSEQPDRRTQQVTIVRVESAAEAVATAAAENSEEIAVVTKMAPPELATHLKLNAHRYTTYAQVKWQVVRSVNLKMPSRHVDMRIGHVEQHGECKQAEQVDQNIDYVG